MNSGIILGIMGRISQKHFLSTAQKHNVQVYEHNSLIIAKATGLIFSLFDIVSAREVPFWHTIVHPMHSLGVLFCVPFIFADSKKH